MGEKIIQTAQQKQQADKMPSLRTSFHIRRRAITRILLTLLSVALLACLLNDAISSITAPSSYIKTSVVQCHELPQLKSFVSLADTSAELDNIVNVDDDDDNDRGYGGDNEDDRTEKDNGDEVDQAAEDGDTKATLAWSSRRQRQQQNWRTSQPKQVSRSDRRTHTTLSEASRTGHNRGPDRRSNSRQTGINDGRLVAARIPRTSVSTSSAEVDNEIDLDSDSDSDDAELKEPTENNEELEGDEEDTGPVGQVTRAAESEGEGESENENEDLEEEEEEEEAADGEEPEVELEDAPDSGAGSGELENEFQAAASQLSSPTAAGASNIGGNFTLRQSTKAKQRRKYQQLSRRIKLKEAMSRQNKSTAIIGGGGGSLMTGELIAAPQLAPRYVGRVRENERHVRLAPKLVILNGVEVCDIELRHSFATQHRGPREASGKSNSNGNGNGNNNNNNNNNNTGHQELPFVISWIDRVTGEATLEARSEQSVNCERQQNFTFRMRAVGCNGLDSEEAQVEISVEDVNEFSPEFERHLYSVSLDVDENEAASDTSSTNNNNNNNGHSSELKLADEGAQQTDGLPPDSVAGSQSATGSGEADHEGQLLLRVRARDQDCSAQFGSICRYELLAHSPASDQSAPPPPPTGIQSAPSGPLAASPVGPLSSLSQPPPATSATSPPQPATSSATSLSQTTLDAFGDNGLTVDSHGRIWLRAKSSKLKSALAAAAARLRGQEGQSLGATWSAASDYRLVVSFQVIAYDCAGKKSQVPAVVQVNVNKLCRPALKDVDTQISYRPGAQEQAPFSRARLDLCQAKCHRPNISMALSLQSATDTPPTWQEGGSGGGGQSAPTSADIQRPKFHCDRDSYSMVSKRRLCGARGRVVELLPFYGAHSKWKRAAGSGGILSPGDQRPEQVVGADSTLAADQPNLERNEVGESPSPAHQQATRNAHLIESDESRTHELEDTSLDSYHLDGSYGRQARAFAALQQQQQQQQHESNATTSQTGSSAATPMRRRAIRRWGGVRSSGRRLISRSAPKYSDSRRHSPLGARRPADSSAIYRDLVYKFDGQSSVMVVPRTVYQLPANGSETSDDSSPSRLFVFGSRHTLSFWMRHGQQQQQHGGSMSSQQQVNGDMSNGEKRPQQQQQQQLHRHHQREHILCAANYEGRNEAHQASGQMGANANHQQQQQPPSSSRHANGSVSLAHRHHYYSVYVRNCKLILLMRRKLASKNISRNRRGEPDDKTDGLTRQRRTISGDSNSTYLPSEWRWTLANNETCDNKWHLYTMNINYPNVELYVDGKQFEENYENLVIVDDIPLSLGGGGGGGEGNQKAHQSPEVAAAAGEPAAATTNILLTLGACWDARQQLMSGHFRGLLSGLTLLMGANEESATVECLGSCTESLVSMANGMPVHDEANGSSAGDQSQDQVAAPSSRRRPNVKLDNSLVAYQESQSRILLSGHDFLDIEDTLAQIAYINRRSLPSIGRRYLTVDTSIECGSASELNQSSSQQQQQQESSQQSSPFQIPIDRVKVEINVLPSSSLPVISIGGTPNLAREYGPFLEGIELFSSISLNLRRLVLSSQSTNSESTNTNSNNNNNKWSSRAHSAALLKSAANSTDEDADYIEDSNLDTNPIKSNKLKLKLEAVGEQLRYPPSWRENVKPVEDFARLKSRLEACSVRVYPPLNSLHESLHLPLEQMDKLQLYWRQSLDGLIIYGLDSVENYQRLLKLIKYKNLRPNLYSERVFRLLCSDMNGRLVSNEYEQTITMIHLRPGEQQADIPLNDAQQVAAESGAARFDQLRRADLPQLDPLGYEELTLANYDQQQQPLKSLFQSTGVEVNPIALSGGKFNRVALAFLVFVVSLIVMLLCIAFVNLREPTASQSPVGVTTAAISGDYCSHKQLADGSLVALTYDIDSARYYDDDDDEDDDENDDGNRDDDADFVDHQEDDDDDDQRREVCYEEVRDIYDEELVHQSHDRCPIHAPEGMTCNYHGHYCHLHRRRRASGCPNGGASKVLAWDEEFFSGDEDDLESRGSVAFASANIVTNPIVHGPEPPTGGASSGTNYKTLVTEQRPDASGSMRLRAVTHLSEDYFPEAYGSEEIVTGPVYGGNRRSAPRQRRRNRRDLRAGDQGQRSHEQRVAAADEEHNLSSFCSSDTDDSSSLTSSTSTSTSSIETDLSDLEFAEAAPVCGDELAGDGDLRFVADHEHEYELFHSHHIHHTCLRQQQHHLCADHSHQQSACCPMSPGAGHQPEAGGYLATIPDQDEDQNEQSDPRGEENWPRSTRESVRASPTIHSPTAGALSLTDCNMSSSDNMLRNRRPDPTSESNRRLNFD